MRSLLKTCFHARKKEVIDILPKVQGIVIMVLIFEDNSYRRIRGGKIAAYNFINTVCYLRLLFIEHLVP